MPEWKSFLHFVQYTQQAQLTAADRQAAVNDLLQQRTTWPWVEDKYVTFIYVGDAQNVAINMDIIEHDPPFIPLVHLEGTNFWYVQHEFERDHLLDYLLAVNDPQTSLREEKDILGRIQRHWRADRYNPQRISAASMETSVLRMDDARPFPDWSVMPRVPRGRVVEHEFSSVQMGFDQRKLWVYTPPVYDQNPNEDYPLLVLFDGQWMVGPLQIPYIADALIKHGKMQPIIIAMLQSGNQAERINDFVANDKYYAMILTELLPLIQTQYRVDPVNMGIGGTDISAVAAAYAALKNPAVLSHLIMISPPLGKGQAQKQLGDYQERFRTARLLPRRIFQSVGRYEIPSRYAKPARLLAQVLLKRQAEKADVEYKFAELGSGHGLVAFKSIFPEALAHTFPPEGS